MAGKLSEGAEAKARLKIVEGDASVDLNIAASFKENHQYVLFAWLDQDTTVALDDYTNRAGMLSHAGVKTNAGSPY